ncbi:hypothetical protein RhiJN_15092 [Ceratobasidium sp. AG-Ba]|nr:hypothetical protein RhiJN_15092 [Ceratobasidium sp. AG-Ba]
MTGEPSNPASPKALLVPEILCLIFNHADGGRDLTRWIRVSRVWFSSCVPYVWRKQVQFRHILSLIPGTISQHNPPARLPPRRAFHRASASGTKIVEPKEELPSEITPPMFDRLRLYAPSIRDVYVRFYGYTAGPSEVEQTTLINLLLQHTASNAMFPNLHSLRIASIPEDANHLGDVAWLFLFASPSIIKFELTSIRQFDEIRKPAYLWVLEKFAAAILQGCPNLQSLCLCIPPRAQSDLSVTASALPVLPELRDLALEYRFVGPKSLAWASGHHRIEYLNIEGNEASAPITGGFAELISPDAFSGLSILSISSLPYDSLSNLWCSKLFRNTVELTLDFRRSVTTPQLAAMLPLIAEHTPRVAQLTFSIDAADEDGELPLYVLGSLPLTLISFSQFEPSQFGLGGSFAGLCSQWSRLESLHLDYIEISYFDLLRISIILPCLVNIAIALPSEPPIPMIDIPAEPICKTWPNHGLEFSALNGPASDSDFDFEQRTAEEFENLGL